MYETNVVEKHKKNILCSITFFFNVAVLETMWKNVVEGAGRRR
jgi:hypothetical protein